LYIGAVRGQAKTLSDSLFAIAEGQQGYFTAKEAAGAGYQLGSQAHHTKSGNWVRVERGIYRLAHFPQSDEEQLVIYALWSRNRAGELEGAYSHETALSIFDLSDVNPEKLHMTVPIGFRRNAVIPGTLVLHHANLDEKEVQRRRGFSVTRPLRSIADLARAESVSRDIVEQALKEGRQRGLILFSEVLKLRRHGGIPGWLDELLAKGK
jgi:predicted transcriptional regulator of viral defense system